MDGHLYRSQDDRMIAGVAGGLAELWDADPSLIRIGWALLVILTGGLALIVYIVMAIVVPNGPPAEDATWSPTAASTPGEIAAVTGDRATARAQRRAARAAHRAERRARGESSAPLIIGALLVMVGAIFLAREFVPQLDGDWVWPMLLIGTGIVILAVAFGDRRAPGGAPGPEPHQGGPTA